jgi:hypothetical protein
MDREDYSEKETAHSLRLHAPRPPGVQIMQI